MNLKKVNKAQISLFVIIVSALVIGGVVFLTFNNPNTSVSSYEFENSNIDRELNEYIQFCVENSSKISAIENLQFGGYYDNAYESINLEGTELAIYVQDEANISPSVEVLEEEFEDSLRNSITSCIDDFSIFENAGFIVENGSLDVSADLFEVYSKLTLQYPVTISKDSNSYSFDSFSYDLEIPILELYSYSQSFIELHESNFTSIPMSSLILLSSEEDFRFELMELDDDSSILYSFLYDFEDEVISYDFVISYDWFEVSEE